LSINVCPSFPLISAFTGDYSKAFDNEEEAKEWLIKDE
jgi:hypothetical protein